MIPDLEKEEEKKKRKGRGGRMITNKGKEGRNVHRGNIMSRQIREAR